MTELTKARVTITLGQQTIETDAVKVEGFKPSKRGGRVVGTCPVCGRGATLTPGVPSRHTCGNHLLSEG